MRRHFGIWPKPTAQANGCGHFTSSTFKLRPVALQQRPYSPFSIAVWLKGTSMSITSIDHYNFCKRKTALNFCSENKKSLMAFILFQFAMESIDVCWILCWSGVQHPKCLRLHNSHWGAIAALHFVVHSSPSILQNVQAFDRRIQEMGCETVVQFDAISYFSQGVSKGMQKRGCLSHILNHMHSFAVCS